MGFFSSLFSRGKKDGNPKFGISFPPRNAGEKEPKRASSEPPPWEVGRLLLNEYRVEGVLGQGGMGTVYLVVRRTTDGERFAVKTLLSSVLTDENRNRLFMRELRTWIGLAEHPHLTACRFFRTIEDRLAIFAEYVEGGSLKEWIKEKKLLGIEKVLDVAIQCAWGLETAHAQGVVHQDMKPDNVLVTKEGIAKITDFGLAHARHLSGVEPLIGGRPQSMLVSAGGMTPAYCSPEQATGQELSLRTDIWSWGLTVLEMFTGSVSWTHGRFGRQALEEFAKYGSNPPFPRMPERAAAVLRRCLEQGPSQRWGSLGEAAEQLCRIYREVSGKDYPRKKHELKLRADAVDLSHDRRATTGLKWDDPREWLAKALRLSGRDASELEDILKEQRGSRKSQALLDLELYERAARIYSDLFKQDRREIEAELSVLYVNKALVHESLADMPGAILMFDRAIEILDKLVVQEGRTEPTNLLAMAYMNKAIALGALGDHRSAVDFYDKVIQIRERLVVQEGRTELANELATAYMNKANALWTLGDHRAEVDLYDKAIQIQERIVLKEGHSELSDELAKTYMNKAVKLRTLGDSRPAVDFYDKAIQIFERMVIKEGRTELTDQLAAAYMNKAIALGYLADHRVAVDFHNKAIQIRERLVVKEGRTELTDGLAAAYMNMALALGYLGDDRVSVDFHDKAIQILERMVAKEGRTELAYQLATAYMNKVNALRKLGEHRAAADLYDKAIHIFERLVVKEGCTELVNALATAYGNKATALSDLGDLRGAADFYEKAIQIYERLVVQEGRSELVGDLCRVKLFKAAILNKLGEIQKAKNEAQAAISGLRTEIKRTGQADLKNVLNWAETYLKMILE